MCCQDIGKSAAFAACTAPLNAETLEPVTTTRRSVTSAANNATNASTCPTSNNVVNLIPLLKSFFKSGAYNVALCVAMPANAVHGRGVVVDVPGFGAPSPIVRFKNSHSASSRESSSMSSPSFVSRARATRNASSCAFSSTVQK